MKRKAYLAGDGLKRGNQILRGYERDQINALGTVSLFNPWDQKDINDKSKNPTAEMIFYKDTKAMLDAEVIIVDADNNSVGTTAEMGQMWGVNYMLDRIAGIAENSKTAQDVCNGLADLLAEIPFKEVHWHTSDVRDTDIPEAGHRRSHSMNQYLYGMMLDLSGKDAMKFEDILDKLK